MWGKRSEPSTCTRPGAAAWTVTKCYREKEPCRPDSGEMHIKSEKKEKVGLRSWYLVDILSLNSQLGIQG